MGVRKEEYYLYAGMEKEDWFIAAEKQACDELRELWEAVEEGKKRRQKYSGKTHAERLANILREKEDDHRPH